MTNANVSDTSRLHGSEKNMPDKTPEEIQLEIAKTKSAITEDLRVLSERFSPQHLREGAREVMRDAREEANLLIQEAKQATIGSLIGAKDRAVESVKESVSEKVAMLGDQARLIGDQAKVLGSQIGDQAKALGTQAKQASDLTVRFVSRNAVAFSLLGVGAGWLLVALRNYRAKREDEYRNYYLAPRALERARVSDTVRSVTGEAVRSVASSATRSADRARAEARSALESTRGPVLQTRGAVRGAVRQARAAANDNKLGVLALTVAAGLGLSLLLPVGRRPRRALLSAGERVWDEAQTRGRQLADRAQSSAHELASRVQSTAQRTSERAQNSALSLPERAPASA